MLILDNATAQSNSVNNPRYEWIAETPYQKDRSDMRRQRQSPKLALGQRSRHFAESVLQHMYKEYTDLMVSFNSQWKEKSLSFSFQDEAVVSTVLAQSIGWLQILGAKKINCEVTYDDSVMLKAQLFDKNLYWEIFFSDEEIDQYEVIVNAYQNKEHVLATGGSIMEVVNKLVGQVSQHASAAFEYEY